MREETLDPQVERELAALDAALAGEPVDPDLTGLAELAVAARAARPAVPAEFASSLDARVAEGFPRPPRFVDRLAAPFVALRARWSRRMLIPALGAAASVVLVVVVATSLIGGGSSDDAAPLSQSTTSSGAGGLAQEKGAAGAPGVAEPAPPRTDQDFSGARRVERQASLILTTSSDKVDDVSDAVIKTTDDVDGIVENSSVSSGDSGRAGATFSLRVPTRRLDDALARLSKLAHVKTRTQNSQDVTAAFTSAQERYDAAVAERKGLLRALARADTENETASIRERLRIVQGEINSARAQVRALRNRTDYSAVSVTIESGGSSGGVSSGSDDKWTPGDAVNDAVRVLEVFAGVALIAIAVLAPLALLGFGAGFASRGLRRRRREHALDAA